MHISSPLTELTRKDVPFTWSELQQNAFMTLKQLITKAPFLHIPDPKCDNTLEIHTDASAKALSGVLY